MSRAAPRTARLGILAALGALAALLPDTSLAAPNAPPPPTAPVRIAVEHYSLGNGLRVILAPDPSAATILVHVWYRVGSRDEHPGKTGFAHLFEHLMFEASRHVPEGEFDHLLEAGGGWNNGSTSIDRTTYYEEIPPHYLPIALYLEADRLAGLWDAMNQRVLDNQRDIVANERRETTENQPYGKAELAIPPALWPAGHGNAHDEIGSQADLEGARLADVEAFWRAHYVPGNATLVLVGRFEVAEARQLIDRYFAWMPARPVPERAALSGPVQPRDGAVALTEPDDVQVPKVIEVWRAPPPYSAGDADLAVAAEILAGGKSSRLYRRLVFADRLAVEVAAGQEQGALGGEMRVEAIAADGVEAAALQAAIDDELERLRRDPPSADEVLRARRMLEAELLESLESPDALAERLAAYDAYTGSPDGLDAELAAYAAVTPASVQAAVQAWMGADARVIMTILPAKQREKRPP